MKKRPANESDDEFEADEPEEFQESGSDWDPEEEPEANKKRKSRGGGAAAKGGSAKKGGGSRNSSSKKKKVEKPASEEEEEDEVDEDEEELEDEEEEESEEEAGGMKGANGEQIKEFTNGAFVVLKSDFTAGNEPPLWRIDGKALLQKYVPFEQDGKTLYKNTSTYSGWTQTNRDQYAPAPVTFIQQGKKEIIIEFNRDKVKISADDGKTGEATA